MRTFIFSSILTLAICRNPLFGSSDSIFILKKPSWSFDIYSGLSIGKQKNFLGTDASRLDTANYNSTALYGSLGAGYLWGMKFNCFFTENLGISFGFQHLGGKSQTYTRLQDPVNTIYFIGKEYGRYNGLTTDIVFRTTGRSRMQATAHIGICFIPQSVVEANLNYIPPSSLSLKREYITYNRPGKGFTNSLGLDYRLSKKLHAGLDFRSLIFTAKGDHQVLKTYILDGEDKVTQLNRYSRETNYVDEISSTSNIDTNPGYSYNKPRDQLAPDFNFSSFMATLRLSWIF